MDRPAAVQDPARGLRGQLGPVGREHARPAVAVAEELVPVDVGALADDGAELTAEATRGILHRGGTILGTSRTNPYKEENGLERVQDSLAKLRLDALIPIGGEDTLGVARRLHEEGIKVVGVPKTIDNDLAGTDFTFGFQTAVQIATDAIDRLHTTAESHNRVIVVEVMGRHAGWIAAYSGMAGGADVILIPE